MVGRQLGRDDQLLKRLDKLGRLPNGEVARLNRRNDALNDLRRELIDQRSSLYIRGTGAPYAEGELRRAQTDIEQQIDEIDREQFTKVPEALAGLFAASKAADVRTGGLTDRFMRSAMVADFAALVAFMLTVLALVASLASLVDGRDYWPPALAAWMVLLVVLPVTDIVLRTRAEQIADSYARALPEPHK